MRGKMLSRLVLIIAILGSGVSHAEAQLWQLATDRVAFRGTVDNRAGAYFATDSVALRNLLENAPAEYRGDASHIITLPLPDGSQSRFSLIESPVMADALAAKFPEIKTYKVFGIDDPAANGRVDISPSGFRAMLYTSQGRVTIDPEGALYHVRSRDTQANRGAFQCRSAELEPGTISSPIDRGQGRRRPTDQHQHHGLSPRGFGDPGLRQCGRRRPERGDGGNRYGGRSHQSNLRK